MGTGLASADNLSKGRLSIHDCVLYLPSVRVGSTRCSVTLIVQKRSDNKDPHDAADWPLRSLTWPVSTVGASLLMRHSQDTRTNVYLLSSRQTRCFLCLTISSWWPFFKLHVPSFWPRAWTEHVSLTKKADVEGYKWRLIDFRLFHYHNNQTYQFRYPKDYYLKQLLTRKTKTYIILNNNKPITMRYYKRSTA